MDYPEPSNQQSILELWGGGGWCAPQGTQMEIAEYYTCKKAIIRQGYYVHKERSIKIKREYEAILCGNLITGGLIDKPIARDNRNREFMKVSKYGRRSITNYRIIRRFLSHTFVRIRLETGRKP